jgi:hypothetical protein
MKRKDKPEQGRELEQYELDAYRLGFSLEPQRTKRTWIERREVHLPNGQTLIEEVTYIEE